MGLVTTDLMISLDGCIAGPGANRTDKPGGDGGDQLHGWIAGLASWRERQGFEGGVETADSARIRAWFDATGAVVMGRATFASALATGPISARGWSRSAVANPASERSCGGCVRRAPGANGRGARLHPPPTQEPATVADEPIDPPTRGPLPGWAPPPHAAPAGRYSIGVVVAALLAGMAAGAIIAGVVVLVSDDVLSRFGAHPVVGQHGPIAEDAETPVLGDCLSSQPALADVTSTDEVVPCTRRHKAEVVGVGEFPTLTNRPRAGQIDDYTSEACALAFDDYTGRDPDTTRYDFGAVVPDQKAWAAGDRRFWCLVDSQSEGNGVGSLRR